MSAYYYLMASVPMLSLGETPAISSEDFRRACAEHLTQRDMAALDALGQEPPAPGIGREWHASETRIRNAAARLRAARLKRDAAQYTREQVGVDLAAEEAVGDAFARPNPMERERAIDRLRWQQIETLTGYDPFSSDAVLAYALKLRLAERWARLEDEAGLERADRMVENEPEGDEEARDSQESKQTDEQR